MPLQCLENTIGCYVYSTYGKKEGCPYKVELSSF